MRLIDRLPDYYRNSLPDVELQAAFQYWIDKLYAARDALLAQLNVGSATWGLTYWETALGIKTDISKSYMYRRARVESKLRGVGIATPEMIKNVAASFSDGDIGLVEEGKEFRFTILFEGIPVNIPDLVTAVREIKPAHLSFTLKSLCELPEATVRARTVPGKAVFYRRVDCDLQYSVTAATEASARTTVISMYLKIELGGDDY